MQKIVKCHGTRKRKDLFKKSQEINIIKILMMLFMLQKQIVR